MVISNAVTETLQYRINQEELSSRIYKAMGIWLNLNGYEGASKLWFKYSCEEMNHAGWVYDYLLDLNIKPIVQQIQQPETEFKGLPNIIAKSLEHELSITQQCKELASLCVEESDYMTLNLAQKFLTEQKEEIAKIMLWVDKLKAFGDSKDVLQELDEQMCEAANG